MLGVSIGPPKVDGLPNPASSMRTTRTLGAPLGALGCITTVQSATESPMVCPATPANPGSGSGRTVRSGANLVIASASESFRAAVPLFSLCAMDRASALPSDLLHAQALLVVEHRDDRGAARRQRLADLVVDAGLHLVARHLAHQRAGGRADHGGGEERRRREAHEEPDTAAPGGTLAAQLVAGLGDGDLAVRVLRDEDGAVDLDRARLDGRDERVEVRGCEVDAGISRDEDIGELLRHGTCLLFRAGADVRHRWCGPGPVARRTGDGPAVTRSQRHGPDPGITHPG